MSILSPKRKHIGIGVDSGEIRSGDASPIFHLWCNYWEIVNIFNICYLSDGQWGRERRFLGLIMYRKCSTAEPPQTSGGYRVCPPLQCYWRVDATAKVLQYWRERKTLAPKPTSESCHHPFLICAKEMDAARFTHLSNASNVPHANRK